MYTSNATICNNRKNHEVEGKMASRSAVELQCHSDTAVLAKYCTVQCLKQYCTLSSTAQCTLPVHPLTSHCRFARPHWLAMSGITCPTQAEWH